MKILWPSVGPYTRPLLIVPVLDQLGQYSISMIFCNLALLNSYVAKCVTQEIYEFLPKSLRGMKDLCQVVKTYIGSISRNNPKFVKSRLSIELLYANSLYITKWGHQCQRSGSSVGRATDSKGSDYRFESRLC